MKKVILALMIGILLGSAITAIAAGIVKTEVSTWDAKSFVGYGTADAGDTIVRIKTTADGTLVINGV
jgi:hypothetical protein